MAGQVDPGVGPARREGTKKAPVGARGRDQLYRFQLGRRDHRVRGGVRLFMSVCVYLCPVASIYVLLRLCMSFCVLLYSSYISILGDI